MSPLPDIYPLSKDSLQTLYTIKFICTDTLNCENYGLNTSSCMYRANNGLVILYFSGSYGKVWYWNLQTTMNEINAELKKILIIFKH